MDEGGDRIVRNNKADHDAYGGGIDSSSYPFGPSGHPESKVTAERGNDEPKGDDFDHSGEKAPKI